MPSEKKKFLQLKNIQNQLFSPFLYDFDTEVISKNRDEDKAYREHEICCIGLYVVNRWYQHEPYFKEFPGENFGEKFMLELGEIAHMFEKVVNFNDLST